MLTRSPSYAHTNPIFVSNDFLKLNSILKFEICKFIHRDFYNSKVFSLTSPRSLAQPYNTRHTADISLSYVRTNLVANFVLHMGIEMYNSLPDDLKYIEVFQKFKQAVKSDLRNIYLQCVSCDITLHFLYSLMYGQYYNTVSHQIVFI